MIQTLGSEGEKSFSLKTALEAYLIYKLHLTPLPPSKRLVATSNLASFIIGISLVHPVSAAPQICYSRFGSPIYSLADPFSQLCQISLQKCSLALLYFSSLALVQKAIREIPQGTERNA